MTRAAAGALALTAALIPWQSTDPTPRFPDRSGPYLGEKPPGLTPELFAPGLVTSLRGKAIFGQGSTIHGAARAGDLATVRALIEQDDGMAVARDEAGRTPLHVAAGSGRADVASFLISRGADVNAADNNAWTSLHAAAAADQDELVRILIDGKAALESRTSEGETPLAVAAARGAA